jgi:hypothetical protein
MFRLFKASKYYGLKLVIIGSDVLIIANACLAQINNRRAVLANVQLTWPAGTFARRPGCTKLWLANRKTRTSRGRPVGVTMGMCGPIPSAGMHVVPWPPALYR